MDTNTEASNDKRKQFSSSKKIYKKFSPWSFAGGMLIVLLAFGLFYVAIPHQQTNKSTNTDKVSQQDKDTSVFKGEHFYRIHHHKHIDTDAEDVILKTGEENMLEKGNLTEKQRKLIELLPNSPVIYLHNFKITDYQKLYYQADGNALIIKDTSAAILINVAMKAFNISDFEMAIKRLKPLLTINGSDPNALFLYRGSVLLSEKLSAGINHAESYW